MVVLPYKTPIGSYRFIALEGYIEIRANEFDCASITFHNCSYTVSQPYCTVCHLDNVPQIEKRLQLYF